MTTHFTSGVTNVKAEGTGGRLKTPDPIKRFEVGQCATDEFLSSRIPNSFSDK